MTLSTSSLIILSTSSSRSDFAISSEQHNQTKSVKHLHRLFSEINDAFFTASDSFSIIAFSSRRSRKRWRRCTQYEKLQIIIKKLQEMRWSVRDFLFTLCKNRRWHTMRKAHDQFLNFAYVDLSDHEDFSQVIEIDRRNILFSKWDWNWVVKTLQQEIKTLMKHDVFESFQSLIKMTELESLNLIKQTVLTIELLISQWLKLIEVICQKNTTTKVINNSDEVFFHATCCNYIRHSYSYNATQSIHQLSDCDETLSVSRERKMTSSRYTMSAWAHSILHYTSMMNENINCWSWKKNSSDRSSL